MQVTIKWDVVSCFFLWFIFQCSHYLILHAADCRTGELGRILKHLWPKWGTILVSAWKAWENTQKPSLKQQAPSKDSKNTHSEWKWELWHSHSSPSEHL